MRAHSRKSSARRVRGDGVTATPKAPDVLKQIMAAAYAAWDPKFKPSGDASKRPLEEHIAHRRLRRLRPAVAAPAVAALGLLEE